MPLKMKTDGAMPLCPIPATWQPRAKAATTIHGHAHVDVLVLFLALCTQFQVAFVLWS